MYIFDISFLILVFVVLMLLSTYQHALATSALLAASLPFLLRQYDAIIELSVDVLQFVTLILVIWFQHTSAFALSDFCNTQTMLLKMAHKIFCSLFIIKKSPDTYVSGV